MSDIKIEKNVPMPKVGSGRRTKYPFGDMDIGDSFSSPDQRVASASLHYGKRHDKKFSMQRQPDGSYRTWRVK